MRLKKLTCILLWLIPYLAFANEVRYLPDDLYRYDQIQAENGFRAVLNQRPGSPNVSIRLVVATGLQDFSCPDRELPHLVEHLMFTGTSEYTEPELDFLVETLGGSWNARTSAYETTYELDIFSGHYEEGVELLHHIFTDTQLTEDSVQLSRDIVHAESGGEPNALRQSFHRLGIMGGSGGIAYRTFKPDSRAYCDNIPTTEHLSLDLIEQYIATHHQPQNMLLVAVGDFNLEDMRQLLAKTFANLPRGNDYYEAPPANSTNRVPLKYETRLDPILSNTSYVSLDFEIENDYGLEKLAAFRIQSFLDAELYNRLRSERGMTYTPSATIEDHGDFATLMLDAEINHSDVEATLRIMEELVTEVAENGIPEKELEQSRQGLLYGLAGSFERNSDYSEIYASFNHELIQGQAIPDLQHLIESVTVDTVREIAANRLQMDEALVYVQKPTLTYTQFGVALVILLALVLWLIWCGFSGRLNLKRGSKSGNFDQRALSHDNRPD